MEHSNLGHSGSLLASEFVTGLLLPCIHLLSHTQAKDYLLPSITTFSWSLESTKLYTIPMGLNEMTPTSHSRGTERAECLRYRIFATPRKVGL